MNKRKETGMLCIAIIVLSLIAAILVAVEELINEGKDWDEVKNANLRAGFKEGYKQGYKDAIDKAYEWLKHNFNMPDDFEIHFRKAMEGQR